jgi:hypothetical protein
VKYSDEAVNLPISITLYLYEQQIIFQVTNHASLSAVQGYQQFIQSLINSDPDDLYTRQLEKTALGTGASNMGLLTMMNDYSARFGWRFQSLENRPDTCWVSVMAHLDV